MLPSPSTERRKYKSVAPGPSPDEMRAQRDLVYARASTPKPAQPPARHLEPAFWNPSPCEDRYPNGTICMMRDTRVLCLTLVLSEPAHELAHIVSGENKHEDNEDADSGDDRDFLDRGHHDAEGNHVREPFEGLPPAERRSAVGLLTVAVAVAHSYRSAPRLRGHVPTGRCRAFVGLFARGVVVIAHSYRIVPRPSPGG
jgi:hypothetical protein